MKTPTVSVLIPTLNGEATIARCIESVLSQDYLEFEVVVIDDGSTDQTSQQLARFNDPRLRVLHNEINSGIAFTYNRALRESSGELVLMLASDCALGSTDYLSRVVHHFEDPSIGALAGKAMMSNFEDAPATERIFTRLNILDVNDPDTEVHRVNFVEVRCDCFRREILVAVGGLNEDLFRSNEDQDLSIRIARRGARLLQDNSLTFELGFGGTQDSLGKLLHKQAQYARGQAYIAVNWGVGSSDGLWTHPSRQRRAMHRMSQIILLPLILTLEVAASFWPFASVAIAVFIAIRAFHYQRLAADLRIWERAAAVPLGLCCDVIYSASFLASLAEWVIAGKTALRRRSNTSAGPSA